MAGVEIIPTPRRGPRHGYLSRSAYFAATLAQLGVSLGSDIGVQTDEEGNEYEYPRGFMVLADGDVTIRSALSETLDIPLVGLRANSYFPFSVRRFTSSGSSPLTASQIVVLY